MKTITIGEYLTRKDICSKKQNRELTTPCLFNYCDTHSIRNGAHPYFDSETGQYECKKCGEKEDIITFAKHLGDSTDAVALYPRNRRRNTRKDPKFSPSLVKEYHQNLPDRIRQYLNTRGITDPIIEEYTLGWGKFYGRWWITMPTKGIDANFLFFRIRQDPARSEKKITYPDGLQVQIYGWQTPQNVTGRIVVCEGELGRLVLMSKGIPAITSAHGAMTFREEWVKHLQKWPKIYVGFTTAKSVKKVTIQFTKEKHAIVTDKDILLTLFSQENRGNLSLPRLALGL